MSFLSRLSNLVSGFSHSLLNEIESNNPGIQRELRKKEIHKQNANLKDASARLLRLEQDLMKRLPSATEEEQPLMQQKIEEYRNERKSIQDTIKKNQDLAHHSDLEQVQAHISSESAAEESLGRLRARTEVLTHLSNPNTPSRKTTASPKELDVHKESDTQDKPKRTL
jgi:hypothetical protein